MGGWGGGGGLVEVPLSVAGAWRSSFYPSLEAKWEHASRCVLALVRWLWAGRHGQYKEWIKPVTLQKVKRT